MPKLVLINYLIRPPKGLLALTRTGARNVGKAGSWNQLTLVKFRAGVRYCISRLCWTGVKSNGNDHLS